MKQKISMKQNQVIQITVKNGFYIGDLSYALSARVFKDVWARCNFEKGAYIDPLTHAQFAAVDTAVEDGSFHGSDGQDYSVNVNNLGICDLDLVNRPQEGAGRIVEDFSGDVTIEYFNGQVVIDWADENVIIDTNPVFVSNIFSD